MEERRHAAHMIIGESTLAMEHLRGDGLRGKDRADKILLIASMCLKQGTDCFRGRWCVERKVIAFPGCHEVAKQGEQILLCLCLGGLVDEPIDVFLDRLSLSFVGDSSWLYLREQRGVGGRRFNTTRHASSLPCRSRRA